MNKYLKTKEGSLEDLAKQMQNKVLESDYQDKFKKELDKAGKPIGQMTGAEKKSFFNKIDKMHTAKNEQAKNPYAIGMAAAMKTKNDQPPLKKSTITKAHDIAKSIEKDQKESVEIKEANITIHDHDSTDKDFKDLVRKSNLTMKVKRGYKGDDVTLSGNPMNIEKMLKTMYGNDWSKTYKRRGNEYIEAEYKKEEVEEQKDSDIPARAKYSKSGGFYYWPAPVKYNRTKKFYYHPKGAKPYPPGLHTKPSDKYEEVSQKEIDKFHTSLDKLVHKSFGHSSDEKKKEMKEARWEIEGRVSYKGIGPEDGFHMVIDAPTESAAEDKAFDELEKARKQRKIGPGGGGSIDDMEIEYIEKTNDRLQPVSQVSLGNSYDPTQKEEVHPHVKKMVKDGESDEKIKKMHPELKDDELEKLKETHSFVTNKQNQKQKEVGGEKEPIKTPKNEWKTFAMMAAELREKKEEKEDKKEMQAGDDTRDKSKKTMTGQIATSPEMNPKVDYKY